MINCALVSQIIYCASRIPLHEHTTSRAEKTRIEESDRAQPLVEFPLDGFAWKLQFTVYVSNRSSSVNCRTYRAYICIKTIIVDARVDNSNGGLFGEFICQKSNRRGAHSHVCVCVYVCVAWNVLDRIMRLCAPLHHAAGIPGGSAYLDVSTGVAVAYPNANIAYTRMHTCTHTHAYKPFLCVFECAMLIYLFLGNNSYRRRRSNALRASQCFWLLRNRSNTYICVYSGVQEIVNALISFKKYTFLHWILDCSVFLDFFYTSQVWIYAVLLDNWLPFRF